MSDINDEEVQKYMMENLFENLGQIMPPNMPHFTILMLPGRSTWLGNIDTVLVPDILRNIADVIEDTAHKPTAVAVPLKENANERNTGSN